MKRFLLAGSHPDLTKAEAEAVLGIRPEQQMGPLFLMDAPDWDGAALQERLAGAVKLGDVIDEVASNQLSVTSLAERIADQIEARPRADRVLFGLTVFGSTKEKAALKKLPIELKRVLQDRGRSVRWVTGDAGEISPAAVAKLKLTTEGYDFVIAVAKDKIVIGLTTNVQNADAWSHRDYGRPFRDARTGMLPPKLARMMMNLAVPPPPSPPPQNEEGVKGRSVLDPFCGGGTVLMEAAMMFPDAKLVGSDIDPRQITGTKQNFEWLNTEGLVTVSQTPKLIVSPARELDRHLKETFDAIVTEGYLGEPLRGHETRPFLMKNKENVEKIWEEALPILAGRLKTGGRLVCVWPAFVTPEGLLNTDADAAAVQAGLKRILGPLPYGRPDQRLVRNLFVYEKS